MDTHSKEFKKLLFSLIHDINSGTGIIARFSDFYLDEKNKGYFNIKTAQEGIQKGLARIKEIEDYFYKEVTKIE